MNKLILAMFVIALLFVGTASAINQESLEIDNIQILNEPIQGQPTNIVVTIKESKIAQEADIKLDSPLFLDVEEQLDSLPIAPLYIEFGDGDFDKEFIESSNGQLVTEYYFTHTYETSGVKTLKARISNDADRPEFSKDITVLNIVEPNLEIVQTELLFGDNNQDRDKTVNGFLTLKNTGSNTINNIQISLSGIDSGYEVALLEPVNSIEPLTSKEIKFSAKIPSDKNSRKESIGSILVIGNGQNIDIPTYMQAKSYLKIKSVKIEFNDDDEKISNGETFDGLKEGDDFTIFVTLENTYSNSDDITIENAYFDIKADENDWDIDDESSEEDIREDSDEEFSLSFSIDDLDSESTDVVIKAYGDDEDNDFEHYDEFSFTLEVDKEKNDIQIKSTDLSDESVSCNQNSVDLEVEIKNAGTKDQDEVAIRVKSSDLYFSEVIDDISLDEGESDDFDFNIDLPSNLRAGSYDIKITTYYDDDEESDFETLTLDVTCTSNTNQPVTTTNQDDNSGITLSNDANNIVSQVKPVESKSNLYPILLIGLAVLLLIGIVFVSVLIYKNK